MTDGVGTVLTTTQPVQVLIRPAGANGVDWQELDRGPGVIHIPNGQEIMLRIKNIGDRELKTLAGEVGSVAQIVALNLSENRNVTDAGLGVLSAFSNLRYLNLSSCGLSNTALEKLSGLNRLTHLDLSYCNRILDTGIKALKSLTNLQELNLQGCVKVTHAGLMRIQRRGLAIKK